MCRFETQLPRKRVQGNNRFPRFRYVFMASNRGRIQGAHATRTPAGRTPNCQSVQVWEIVRRLHSVDYAFNHFEKNRCIFILQATSGNVQTLIYHSTSLLQPVVDIHKYTTSRSKALNSRMQGQVTRDRYPRPHILSPWVYRPTQCVRRQVN